jgi:hypothetical protein
MASIFTRGGMFRLKVVLGVLVFVLAAAVCWYLGEAARARGPVYKGRPLVAWIHRLGGSNIPNEIWGSPSRSEAADAIRAIGPAGIPILVESLQDPQWYVRLGAADGLYLLGPQAVSARASLVQAGGRESNRMVQRHIQMAIEHLSTETGDEGEPERREALTESEPSL